jgi:hypothetical protein
MATISCAWCGLDYMDEFADPNAKDVCTDCTTDLTPCPNHEGAYDCTPFCEVCAGEQHYEKESN